MNEYHEHRNDEMQEESEFWLFTDPSPLPSLQEIKTVMEQAYPQFSLTSQGRLDTLHDGIVNGLIVSPGDRDVEEIATAWMVELLDAKRFFKKEPYILKDLGGKTQMVRVTVSDHFSIGHAFSMLFALLTLRDGILSIPSPEEDDVYVFKKVEALSLLKEQLDEFDIETEEAL